MAIGLLIPAGLGIFCCYFFWCWPARLAWWPLQSGSMWHTIVDDDVEAASIYRCNGKAGQPIIRPHKNHDLHMEWEPTQDRESTEAMNSVKSSSCIWDHWTQLPKSRECYKHIWFVVRLRIGPVAASLNRLIDLLWRTIAASHSTTRTCAQLDIQLQNNTTSFPFEEAHTKGTHHRSKDMHHFLL